MHLDILSAKAIYQCNGLLKCARVCVCVVKVCVFVRLIECVCVCVCVAEDICVVVISAEFIQTCWPSQMTQEESSIARRHGAVTQLQGSRLTFETNFHHNFPYL